MLYYVRLCVNNGYGQRASHLDTMQEVREEDVIKLWSLGEGYGSEEEDELIERSGFSWNVGSDIEGEELIEELKTKRLVCREYEGFICCVGEDKVAATNAAFARL